MTCSTCPAKALLNNSSPVALTTNDVSCGKLNTYAWLDNIPSDGKNFELMEVRFKNTRIKNARETGDDKIQTTFRFFKP